MALTLRQPWASAVVHLGKDVENRSWTTPFRGVFAIHAGLGVDLAPEVSGRLEEKPPSGCVIAVARLRDVVRDSRSRWAVPGFYHWLLEDVRQLSEPVPCTGRQMLFRLPEEIEAAVFRVLVQ